MKTQPIKRRRFPLQRRRIRSLWHPSAMKRKVTRTMEIEEQKCADIPLGGLHAIGVVRKWHDAERRTFMFQIETVTPISPKIRRLYEQH